jgi:hypothetical protein
MSKFLSFFGGKEGSVALGLELRALCLLGRPSYSLSHSTNPHVVQIETMILKAVVGD